MTHHFEALAREAWAPAVAMIAACLVAIAASMVRSPRSPQLGLALAPLAALGVAVLALLWLVSAARAATVHTLFHPMQLSDEAMVRAAATSTQMTGLLIGAAAIGIAAPFACFGAAVRARPDRKAALAAATGASLVVLAVCAATAWYAWALLEGMSAAAYADPWTVVDSLNAMIERAPTSLAAARGVVLAIALAAGIATAVLASRAQLFAGPRMFASAIAIGAVGAGAFAATRGLAHDAAHPIRADHGHEAEYPDGIDAPDLVACAHQEFLAEYVVLYGAYATRYDESERYASPDALRAEFAARRIEWLERYSGSFPHGAMVVADARSGTFAPWLRAMLDAGYVRVYVLAEQVTTFETATLGRLVRRSRCGAELTLDPAGAPPPSTWQELATAALRANGQLRVAP